MAHTYTVLYGYSIAHYRILRICINSITVRTRTAVLMPTSAVPPVATTAAWSWGLAHIDACSMRTCAAGYTAGIYGYIYTVRRSEP